MIRSVMIAVIVSALASCAQAIPKQNEDGVLLRAILPPESLGRYLSLSQQVVGEFQDQEHALRVEVELTPTRLVMVGLTHLGVPVFSLEQDSGGIEVEALGTGRLPFNPRYILSDFQIVFWPASILREKFRSFGLSLADGPAGDTRKVLGENREVLVEVTYLDKAASAGDIVVEHFDHPYRLYIKTFDTSGPEGA